MALTKTTGTVSNIINSPIENSNTLYPEFKCRAWVNFNGTVSANLTGTFSQVSSTTVTIIVNGHGLVAGHSIYITFSATLTSGIYTVASVIDSNTFTITTSSGSSSGTVTLNRRLIRGSGNVSNVVNVGTGIYTINFTTPMPDTNYTLVMSADGVSNGTTCSIGHGDVDNTGLQLSNARIESRGVSSAATTDVTIFCVSVFR